MCVDFNMKDLIATGGSDATIKLWNMNSGSEARTLSKFFSKGVNCLAFTRTLSDVILACGLEK